MGRRSAIIRADEAAFSSGSPSRFPNTPLCWRLERAGFLPRRSPRVRISNASVPHRRTIDLRLFLRYSGFSCLQSASAGLAHMSWPGSGLGSGLMIQPSEETPQPGD